MFQYVIEGNTTRIVLACLEMVHILIHRVLELMMKQTLIIDELIRTI